MKEWHKDYWLDSIRVPKPMKDETLIQTISSLGQTTGYFCWPTYDLERFKLLNSDSNCPLYFAWNDTNDMSKSVTLYKSDIPSKKTG